MEKYAGIKEPCYGTFLRNIIVNLLQKDYFPTDRFNIKDATLEIRKTRRQDAGLYLLEASNDLGEKSKEVFLTVQYFAM